ncbi:MAG TPA: phosphatase PAP2 family protein [Acholeplasma sp.]|jgi:membrane-associated phospholipid phosphatase|nr:phosphatase PAP2 family protein [Acholeplasma sp.]
MRNFELDISRFFRSISTETLDKIVQILTFMGSQIVIIVIVAIIYFVLDKKAGEKIIYITLTSYGVNNALKGLFAIKRPFQVDPDIEAAGVSDATGYSFPSGHSQGAASVYFSIANHFKKRWLWIISIVIITIIGFTRIWLGVHFLSDVVVGISLGIGISLLCGSLYDTFEHSFKSKIILLATTLIIFAPFLFIFYRPNVDDMLVYRDFYISYAAYLGFFGAVIIENKLVKFTDLTTLGMKILRAAIGIAIMVGVYLGLKFAFPDGYMILDMLRYFLVIFIGLGIYPLIFKNTPLFKYIYKEVE